ncbi:MAG: hypothetical protein LCH91_14140 [Bacteroidetes bacterium]|nr:hypothetical protein [Bacteroidota bacterium]
MSNLHYVPGSDYDVAILASSESSVFMKNSSVSTRPGSSPTMPVIDPYSGYHTDEVEMWGVDNNFPQTVINDYYKDTVVVRALNKMTAKVIGNGIMPVNVTGYDANGVEQYTPIMDDDIWEFFNSEWTEKYTRELVNDLVWFFNAFSEIHLSKNRKRILYFVHQEASYCRWSKQDKQTGRCDFVHINANWPNVQSKDPYSTIVKAIDPYDFQKIEKIQSETDYKYIYPVSHPTPGKTFYQLAYHDSIRQSGWLEVHLAIPQFKKYLMQNQMTIKYHWKIDERYWPTRYGDRWEKAKVEQRRDIRKEWLTEMDRSLAESAKTGKSISTPKFWDEVAQKYQEYIELTTIDDAKLDNKYIEDSIEAAYNISYGTGIDGTELGLSNKTGGSSRGSGSDMRESWLIAAAEMKPYRDALKEPFMFAARYNGWTKRYPKFKIMHRDTILTTLNTGAGTDKKIS